MTQAKIFNKAMTSIWEHNDGQRCMEDACFVAMLCGAGKADASAMDDEDKPCCLWWFKDRSYAKITDDGSAIYDVGQ